MMTIVTFFAPFAAALLGAPGAVPCDSPPAKAPVAEAPAVNEAPAAPAADPAVVDWLDKLEKRGQELDALAADVVYQKANTLTGGDEVRTGKVAYRAADPPEQPSARFVIDFDAVIINNARRKQNRDFVFDGTWLVERDHDKKLFQKRQIVAPGETFDPLKIDGPFPVPIGQKRDEVLARFDVKMMPDDAELQKALGLDKPPLHLKLKPKADAPRAEGTKSFETVDLWFDRDRLVPVKIATVDRQSETTVTLRNVQTDADVKLDDKLFDTKPPGVGEGWRVEITPWRR